MHPTPESLIPALAFVGIALTILGVSLVTPKLPQNSDRPNKRKSLFEAIRNAFRFPNC